MPYISTSTGTIAQVNQYNYSQSLVKDIIGLGQDGWGQSSQNSSPVTTRSRQSRAHWVNITNDLNFIQQHILNSQTTGLVPATATTIVTTFPNAVGALVDSLAAQRYQCHPSQFYGYPGAVINTLNGTTTRTTPWGKEISQQVRVDWPTNLFARYFFNSGSVFTWRPNYTSIAQPNDRDEEWADFIDYIQAQPAYEYTRSDFLDSGSATKITTYNSGTLTVLVTAVRNGTTSTATRVDFTALFRNQDLGYITVEPERGYWNYGPWETP
jgi:hypothetical protein